MNKPAETLSDRLHTLSYDTDPVGSLTYADKVLDDFGVLADDGNDDRRRVLVVRVSLLDVRSTVHHGLNGTHVVRPTSLTQRRSASRTDLLYVGTWAQPTAVSKVGVMR